MAAHLARILLFFSLERQTKELRRFVSMRVQKFWSFFLLVAMGSLVGTAKEPICILYNFKK